MNSLDIRLQHYSSHFVKSELINMTVRHQFTFYVSSRSLKCIWHEKYFLLILKAFQNTEEWRFSFWNIFFRFRDIDVFLLCKLDQWWRHIVCNYCKNGKILTKQYLQKYWSSVLETWHHKCASQEKHNDTLNAIAMATVWPLVLS